MLQFTKLAYKNDFLNFPNVVLLLVYFLLKGKILTLISTGGLTPEPEGSDAPTSAYSQVPGATLGSSGTAKSV